MKFIFAFFMEQKPEVKDLPFYCGRSGLVVVGNPHKDVYRVRVPSKFEEVFRDRNETLHAQLVERLKDPDELARATAEEQGLLKEGRLQQLKSRLYLSLLFGDFPYIEAMGYYDFRKVLEARGIFGIVRRSNERDASEKEIRVTRIFFANSTYVNLDDVNRIVLPSQYKRKAGIEDRVVFVANNDRMEIWNPKKLEQALLEAQS